MPDDDAATSDEQEERLELVKERGRERVAKRLASSLKPSSVSALQSAKKYQNLFRILTGGSALTFWGIVLALAIALYQLIFGNILRSQILPAPPLEWKDVGILLFILALAAFIVVPIVMVLLNPCMLVQFIDLGWLSWARDLLEGRCPELLGNAL